MVFSVKRLKYFLPVMAAMVPAAGAATLFVPAGGDLQSVLNAVRPGDTVQLAAGAQWTGHFFLQPNPGSQWITIQSASMGALPGPGSRISSAQSASMPKLITPDGAPALQMTTGANYYRIQGIEFAPAAGVYVQDLVQVGNGSEPSVGQLPHDIDFDRDYIHANPVVGSKRGIALNGVNITVENSYIAGFTSTGQDTQAIAGWNGAGPLQIVNNYLEGGTENLSFGGAIPSIAGLIPSDITVRNNTFNKPLSWKPGSSTYAGVPVWSKNHIELKNAQRITIDGNTFDNNWVGADQRGFALVFNVRCENGAVPWAVVNNVTVTNNTVRHAAAGMVFVGKDSASGNEGSAGQIVVQNNTFQDISDNWGGDGRLFQIQAGVQGLNFDHNTAFQTGYFAVFDTGASYNVNFTNNIALVGAGVAGNGSGGPIQTLASYAPGGQFLDNALIGGNPAQYPASNYFPATVNQVGFVDYANGNFQLGPASSLLNAGTDGKSLGYSAPGSTSAPAPVNGAPTIPTGWVQLVNRGTGSCLDIIAAGNGSELQPGTRLQQWSCWGGTMQQFQLNPVSGGYEITNRASGLQLDVLLQGTADLTPIIQYPFWGGTNQIWTLVNAGGGYYSLSATNSGKCIDVLGGSTANGAPIAQFSCNGGTSQQFRLVPVQ